jgi:TetR/AcrR family transcriptional regulator
MVDDVKRTVTIEGMDETTRRPRRSPAPEDRKADADRSRRRLLDAALDEFAAKGFAGARVHDIAERAGVNKQLISYYFGGKEGLYRSIQERWLEHESDFNTADVPLDELVARYARHTLKDPRGTRLAAWQGLTGASGPPADGGGTADIEDLERRKAEGQLADELDPRAVLLLFMAAVSAPIVMPQKVRELFGVDPGSPEFEERYTEQLRAVVRRLA